jgi:Ca2+-binding EF-hand superfamily protein
MKKLNTNFKMKRSQIVDLLVKEGFSHSTLVAMSDKQLGMISERIVVDAEKLKTSPELQALAKDPNTEVEVKEELKGGQKKLDKNHNGKIDAQDFKILKGQKKKEVKEELKGNQEKIDKNKNGKIDSEDFKLLKSKKKTDIKKKLEDLDKKEVNEWVDKLVENDYHSLTTKDEIMELIKIKLNEQPDVMEPDIDVEPDIDIEPDIDSPPSPDKDPFIDPWQNPGEGPDPRPKFETGKGMPEFLKFKNILKSMNQPKNQADTISESVMNKIRKILK